MSPALDQDASTLRQLFELAQDVAHVGYWEWDTRTNEVYWSRQKIEIYGEQTDRFQPSFEKFLQVIDDETRERVMSEIRAVLGGDKAYYDLQHQIRLRNGRKAWVHEKAFLTRDEQGNPLKLMGIVYDVTDKILMLENLRDLEATQAWLKSHDALTGLKNRNALEEQLAEATRRQQAFTLVFLDLYDFKTINNAYGHLFGDVVLKRVGEAFQQQLPDRVFRYGADEFVLLLKTDETAPVMERLSRFFSKPMYVLGNRINLSYACGSADFPQDGQTTAELVKNANSALSVAKQGHLHGLLAYKTYMGALFSSERKVLDALHQALEERQLIAYYQPKVDVSQQRILGMEALVRWRDRDGEWIPPSVFLPVAEKHDLLPMLDQLVLQQAVEQLQQWQAQGYHLELSVNMTATDFHDPAMVNILLHQLEPAVQQALMLEITENDLMQCDQEQIKLIEQLKNKGLRLSLDDFGTGYSSLRYLHQLPIDQLKIDRSFVKNLPGDRKDEQLVAIIRDIVQRFELDCVVEGIETEAQRDYFLTLGLSHMQGFLFGQALSGEEITSLLAQSASIFQPLDTS